MPPAVAPASQMRRTIATVFVQRDGNFVDDEFVQRGLDHHLGGKLHAGRAQIHLKEGGFCERT